MSTKCKSAATARDDVKSTRKKLVAGILLGLSLAAASAVQATTFTVANTGNAGAGSLRDAISQANADVTPPTVVLIPSGITGSIVLTTGQIEITNAMAVQGPGASKLTVSGNNNDRVFYAHPAASGSSVTISGLTLTHGNTAHYGGALYSTGTNLTVTNCDFENNSATGMGGAMYVYAPGGNVTISGVTAQTNSASAGGGIGMNVRNGVATITNSVVSGNTAATSDAGGIYLLAGSVTMTSTHVVNNHAPNHAGGGIAALEGDLTISDSQVSGNTAGGSGGGIYLFDASMAMNRTLVDGNSSVATGGGLALYHAYYNPTDPGTTITNSTISNNHATADNGGGIAAFDDANVATTLSNVTIYGNTAAGSGGAIYSSIGKPKTGPVGTAALTIESSTIVDNHAPTGGGIVAAAIGNHIALHDDIVANNIATAADPDVAGSFDAKYNFIKSATGAVLTGGNNTTGVDPALGPLALNGGPTPTLRPSQSSPVVDAGDPAFVSTHDSTDQRGLPRVVGANIDLGAVERQTPEDVIFINGFDML